MSRFPFGSPSTARPPRRPVGAAKAFVLGVYPSALHVRWAVPASAPAGLPRVVGALAVADEPTVFWDGADAEELVRGWKREVGFREGDGPNDHGHATAAGNGTSGRPVIERVLQKLGVDADDAWLTDAVDQFFVKRGARQRQQGDVVDDVYNVFARSRPDLRPAELPSRPSVNELVQLATTQHRQRLRGELREAAAPLLITLGEEARRVAAAVCDEAEGAPLTRLTQGPDVEAAYGREGAVALGGLSMRWLALVHPGNRSPYWASLHRGWMSQRQ